MIQTLARVIGMLAVLHVVAALGLVGWLVMTDRLDRDRLDRVVDVLAMTRAEEAAAEEARAAAEAEAIQVTERVMALQEKAAGVGTADERVEDDRKKDELTLGKLERMEADVKALRRNLSLAQDRVRDDQEALQKKQEQLNARLAELEKRANDEGFAKAVALYEALPPKQCKDMFIELIESGSTDQVVAYLEAMEPRKAAKILQEFKKPAELERATQLTEALRARGSQLVAEAAEGAAG